MKKALVCIMLLSLFLLGASGPETIYVIKEGAFGAGSLAALESLGRCFAASDQEAALKLLNKNIVFNLPPGTLCYISQRVSKTAIKIRIKGEIEEYWTFPWYVTPYKKGAAK